MSHPLSRALLALILILTALALMLLSMSGYLQPLESALLRPVAGVQHWISDRYSAIRDLLTTPGDIASLRTRIVELEAANAALVQDNIALREQLAETETLAALLDYARTKPDSRYLAADVIGKDVSPFLRWVMIDAGSDNGLRQGMPVVTADGLVGRLVDVYANVSRVQLITDPQSAVNVRFQSSRAEGVLVAELNGELHVDLINPQVEILPGELVLTSGLGGGYPDGILVGQVISVRERDFELFLDATIEPAVDFGAIDIMLVITNFRRLPIPQSP